MGASRHSNSEPDEYTLKGKYKLDTWYSTDEFFANKRWYYFYDRTTSLDHEVIGAFSNLVQQFKKLNLNVINLDTIKKFPNWFTVWAYNINICKIVGIELKYRRKGLMICSTVC